MKSKKFLIFRKLENSLSLKKAQLTAFMLLGFFILAVFSLVFFGSSQVQKQQAQAQADKIFNNIVETTALKFYISRCTDRALISGVDVLSKQGGKIFPGQMGSLMNHSEKTFIYTDNQRNKTYQVNYGILKGETPLPQWPCKIGFENYDVPPAFCFYNSKNEIKFGNLEFGINNMPTLCKDRFGGCSISEGWNPYFSVQSQLEKYISEYVDKCVNFSSVGLEQINSTYNIRKGNITSKVIFSDRDITATVNFPLEFSAIAGQPIIRFIQFQAAINTRFKVLYSLAKDYVSKEVSSPSAITFETIPGLSSLVYNRYGVTPSALGIGVENYRNFVNNNDLIRIYDKNIEQGRDLIVQFLIENRPPVLEYIAQYDGAGMFSSYSSKCGDYDVIQTEDSLLNISLKGFDLEDRATNYSFSGWLFDYNETNYLSQLKTQNNCPIVLSSQTKITEPRWIITNDSISTYVTKNDLGPHNITVRICDKQYCDIQVVRIMINDVMKIIVNKTNPYNSSVFSIEDPYYLTAAIEDVYLTSDITQNIFNWNITNRTNSKLLYSITEAEQTLKLPIGNYDILNITQVYNKSGFYYNLFRQKYDANASVPTFSARSGEELEAFACVAYRNPENPPFPYNKSDPFFSDHSCCNVTTNLPYAAPKLGPGGNQGTTCFSKTTYGSIFSFNRTKYNTVYDKSSTFITTGFNVVPPVVENTNFNIKFKVYPILNNSNDIIKREYKTFCDGKRGNVCLGPIVETYCVIEDCANVQMGETAACSGPSKEYLLDNSETDKAISCIWYDNTTFEKLIGVKNDVICNSQPRCVYNPNDRIGFVNINPPFTGATPHYFCNATCDSINRGCTKTTPELCINCYSKQTCTQENNGVSNVNIYSSCVSGAGCSVMPLGRPTQDYCDGNILTKFYCKADVSFDNVPYYNQTTDCSTQVPNAIKIGNICTDYKGLCQSNQCISQLQNYQDVVNELNTTSGLYYNITYLAQNKVCYPWIRY